MPEVPIKRTPWTTPDLLAAYAEAWRTPPTGTASRLQCYIASLKIVGSALTDAEVLAESELARGI